jgi:hypothetical protein
MHFTTHPLTLLQAILGSDHILNYQVSARLTVHYPVCTAKEGIQKQKLAYKDAVYRRLKEWISSTLMTPLENASAKS